MICPLAIRLTRSLLIVAFAATSATVALGQFEGYPSTGDYPQTQPSRPLQPPPTQGRYPPREPAPVIERGVQAQNQPYHEPYARTHAHEARPFSARQSLGPYDDRRRREEFQPDFNRPGRQVPQRELFEPGKVIAIVGEETILAGDLYGDINQMLAPYKDKATKEQLDEQRQLLLRKLLPQRIQTKMLYQEMLANVPEEAVPQIEAKLASEFDDKQLPNLMERADVDTLAELDAKLREFGSSIDKQRRQFAEQILAREVVRQNVDAQPSVSHQEMLHYYRENAAEYERPARVRWEELAVRFDEFDSKAQAYRAIANMGNRVLRGAAFSRVAREQSQGFTAEDGGWHDWTLKNSLKAKAVEEALFTLPLNQLSRILESEWGFHIVRVLDREEAGRTPFFQEQVNIKEKLQKEKRDEQVDEYLAEVKERTRVWTIFDDPAGAEELAEQ